MVHSKISFPQNYNISHENRSIGKWLEYIFLKTYWYNYLKRCTRLIPMCNSEDSNSVYFSLLYTCSKAMYFFPVTLNSLLIARLYIYMGTYITTKHYLRLWLCSHNRSRRVIQRWSNIILMWRIECSLF